MAALGADDQVDVGDLIAITDQRLANEEIRCHVCLHLRFEERKDLLPHSVLDRSGAGAQERRGER